jgi:hypothetical protein
MHGWRLRRPYLERKKQTSRPKDPKRRKWRKYNYGDSTEE